MRVTATSVVGVIQVAVSLTIALGNFPGIPAGVAPFLGATGALTVFLEAIENAVKGGK